MNVKSLKFMFGALFVVWFVGAVVMTVVYELERRSDCIKEDGWFKGVFFCSSSSYNQFQQTSNYLSKFIKGLAWPYRLISFSTNDEMSEIKKILLDYKQPYGSAQRAAIKFVKHEKRKVGRLNSVTSMDDVYFDVGSNAIKYQIKVDIESISAINRNKNLRYYFHEDLCLDRQYYELGELFLGSGVTFETEVYNYNGELIADDVGCAIYRRTFFNSMF